MLSSPCKISDNAQNKTNLDKLLHYVSHTGLFEHLRNHYQSFRHLNRNQIALLVKSGQILRITQQKTMMISFNQPTICVIVYGNLIVEGKRYSTGKYFVVADVKIDIAFHGKSLLVMLNKESVQSEMHVFQDHFFKQRLIQKLLPCDLKLTHSQLNNLVAICDFRTCYSGQEVIGKDKKQQGIFLLLDGNFSISSLNGIKIGELNFDYFGEQILWEKQYQYKLNGESVECRYVFLNKTFLANTLTASNLRVLKNAYIKRVSVRRQLQRSLNDNINYTRDFMKKLNLNKRSTVLMNQEYTRNEYKKNKKSLNFQNLRLMNLNKSLSKKITLKTDLSEDKKISQDESLLYENKSSTFQPKLYRDQKAKSQHIFKRRVKSQTTEKQKMDNEVSKQPNVANKDLQNLKNLPKTLSVLLKYYESTQKNRPRPKTVAAPRGGFASSSRQRRLMTTMKLHKEIFMRQYFEIKSMEDKAFKTWR